jgi:hypothetical protein
MGTDKGGNHTEIGHEKRTTEVHAMRRTHVEGPGMRWQQYTGTVLAPDMDLYLKQHPVDGRDVGLARHMRCAVSQDLIQRPERIVMRDLELDWVVYRVMRAENRAVRVRGAKERTLEEESLHSHVPKRAPTNPNYPNLPCLPLRLACNLALPEFARRSGGF